MSAPMLWSFIPLFIGIVMLFFAEYRKFCAVISTLVCGVLILIAVTIPVNSMIIAGKNSIIFTSSTTLLGRTLTIHRAMQPMVAFFYSLGLLWIIASLTVPAHRLFIPIALIEIALLISVMAVKPFIYGAFLVELASLVIIPLFWIQKSDNGIGILRFLLYQTLGLILLSLGAWLSSSVDINPSDQFLVTRTVIIFFLGFIFWLAIFPFHNWIGMLLQGVCPYISGFAISLFQFSALFILLNFLNAYTWMRSFEPLFIGLRVMGMILMGIGGLWALFQRTLQRLEAFLLIAENGIAMILLGIKTNESLSIFLSLLFIRVIATLVWSVAVKSIATEESLSLESLKGLFYRHPVFSVVLLVSYFSVAGLPLLSSFPLKISMISMMFSVSTQFGIVTAIGYWLVIAAGFRLAAILFAVGETHTLQSERKRLSPQDWRQMLIMSVGIFSLLLISLYPNLLSRFVDVMQTQFTTLTGG